MEVTNHTTQEIPPAAIVEGTEAQVFARQTEGQDVVDTSGAETHRAEGRAVASEGDTKPEEKPAPKPKVNKRPYIEFISEQLEDGLHTRKELVELVLKQYPTVKKSSIETFLTDVVNPKYSHFSDRPVTKLPDGKLVFTDRVQEPVKEPEPTETRADTPAEQPAE